VDPLIPPRLVPALAAIIASGPYEAALWDFDGVITDSEPVQRESYLRMLRARGIEPDPGFFHAFAGRNEEQIWDRLCAEHSIGESIESLRTERFGVYRDIASRRLTPSWISRALLPALSRSGARQIIISAGNTILIEALLDGWNLRPFFSEIRACGGEPNAVAKKQVLKAVLAASGRALVIEDHAGYLQLARELGATTVGVRHSLNHLRPDSVDFLLDIAS
jgi:beta-phosphoglucomutase-like phosphatase (HAD superfamily)